MLRKSKDASYFIDRYEDLQNEIDGFDTLDESDFDTVEEFEAACDEQAEDIAILKDEQDTISEAQFLSRDDYLIHDDEFEEYVFDFVKDTFGEIPFWIEVDWEATADNVRSDYTVVELENDTYYYRS